jgi:hypothetical protein
MAKGHRCLFDFVINFVSNLEALEYLCTGLFFAFAIRIILYIHYIHIILWFTFVSELMMNHNAVVLKYLCTFCK